MKVPLSWLRELVEITLPAQKLAHRLTMAGLEVEDVHTIGSEWDGVLVGRVTDLSPHPRADSLQVARVDVGGRAATVVTGAPNVEVGALFPYVRPGGRLAGGEISARTFQGITSEGMLCSADELGISPDHEGLYRLEESAKPGQSVADLLAETVLDLYITPNRPDCMSIVGVAREVHALTGAPLTERFQEVLNPPRPAGEPDVANLVEVRIEDPEGCLRFVLTVLRGLSVHPSPHWLQRRLAYAGVRPISNLVDVTNYVMLELGEPLHAFDRTRFGGRTMVIRRARPGERLVTLDGEERILTSEMMVVADEERARSLAGVMGGLDSGIQDDTTDVLLEGASWDRASIRRTCAATGLQSEASRRFGRGIDPDLASGAVARAAALMLQLGGGSTANGIVDAYPGRAEPQVVELRNGDLSRLLGVEYPRDKVTRVLRSLAFQVDQTEAALVVTVPGHRRFDVSHPADLAEEVARIVGYETVPATSPLGRLPSVRTDGDGGYADELLARRLLVAAGLQEVITYSLVHGDQQAKMDATAPWPQPAGIHVLETRPDEEPAETGLVVANPMSVEHRQLRSSILGSLLETVRANLRHESRVHVFELGRTWRGDLEPLPDERRHVAIALAGPRSSAHWSERTQAADFFDLKGVVGTLCERFGVPVDCDESSHPSLHPGQSARVTTARGALGTLGRLHPRVAERFDLEGQSVLVAELDFELMLAARGSLDRVSAPARYPPAERDISLVVADEVAHAAVERVLLEAAGTLLLRARLFDVYRGDPIPAGHKSLAYALVYQATDRTLSDEEVATCHERVERALADQLGAEVRGR